MTGVTACGQSPMNPPIWQIEIGDGPLVACALHDGGAVRAEVAAVLRISPDERRVEEDPYTADWTTIAPTRIVARRSRFEVDLNRPRHLAIYSSPDKAWGLDVWRSPPLPDLVERSLTVYDEFYAHMRHVLERLVARHGRVVVFDLHSYNHRRSGRDAPAADPQENPEINLGTRSLDRVYWSRVVERWLAEMRGFDYLGGRLDVRENVRFFGGHFSAWIHQQFPGRVCTLAIEVKKIFMDEWTGRLDEARHRAVGEALHRAAAGALEALENWEHDAVDA